MFARRTFIVRLTEADRTVLIENSLTRERVRLRALSQVAGQIERWLSEGESARASDAEGAPHESH